MNRLDVTPRERLRIVQSLLTGLTLDEVADELNEDTAHKTTQQDVDRVRDIAAVHGYPRQDAMKRAAAVLKEQVANGVTQVVYQGTPQVVADRRPPEPNQLSIEAILAEAEKHRLVKIRTKATSIRSKIAELRTEVEEQRVYEKERQQREAERQAAKAKIAELEAQIRKIRASIGDRRAPSQTDGRSTGMRERHERKRAWLAERGTTFAAVKAWAEVRGYSMPSSLIPAEVCEAWDQAHREDVA
jgi:hypothetical protein